VKEESENAVCKGVDGRWFATNQPTCSPLPLPYSRIILKSSNSDSLSISHLRYALCRPVHQLWRQSSSVTSTHRHPRSSTEKRRTLGVPLAKGLRAYANWRLMRAYATALNAMTSEPKLERC
jgi:hypothetical protein